MSLDFQQVRQQIKALGEQAPYRARHLAELRRRAAELLARHAQDLDALRQRVQTVTRLYDPNLRCALPALEDPEPLNAHCPLPPLPSQATVLAADGSQIAPDRHAEVNYGLINVGAVRMCVGLPDPPAISVQTQLMYDLELITPGGTITEERLALMRDLAERRQLATLAAEARAQANVEVNTPVITFTDGPMELWGAKDSADSGEFERSLEQYHAALTSLYELGAATAGYVDKPFANLVVRLLEVASLPESQLPEVKNSHPLQGALDLELFRNLLAPGERSAVFALQSRSAQRYRDDLALHFFYLNVGRQDHPWLSRVEIPAWVARDRRMLDDLHAVLIQQCRILGSRPFPYLLHRAHEAAVVTLEEKDQVTQMIALELRRRGVEVGEISHKQSAKIAGGKTRYRTWRKVSMTGVHAPAIPIGRLLRAGTPGFVVGCRVSQLDSPSFGALVKAPAGDGYEIFGLIYDIHVDDDGLVRQLVTAEGVDESVINDNRLNRNVPLEMSVLAVGYRQGGQIYHLLPPRPPLSLDVILLCGADELRQFTSAGRFGYFRHVLRAQDLPAGEVLAAHVQQAQQAHAALGDPGWSSRATQELITLLRDDYPALMQVLGALGDVVVGDADVNL